MRLSAVLALVAGLFVGAASLPSVASESHEQDLKALRQVHDDWIAAYASGDVDALERFYLPTSVIMPDGRPTCTGWDEIRAFFVPGFERFNYQADANLQSVTVSGDLAALHGEVKIALTPKAGGDTITRTLRYLIVFTRHTDGSWRILLDADNRASTG